MATDEMRQPTDREALFTGEAQRSSNEGPNQTPANETHPSTGADTDTSRADRGTLRDMPNSVGSEESGVPESTLAHVRLSSSLDSKASDPSLFSRCKARALQFGPVVRVMSAVDPEHADSLKSAEKPSHKPRRWRTALIRFGPLSGIFCMCLALGSIVAALGILAGSDGQPVTRWSAPPSTYLAIFTAIANLSVRYAAVQGVVIAWWSRASKGSTLDKLHWDWRAGSTVRGALTAGRHMGLLGLACIFSTVVVIDGPLLQRASTVINSPLNHAIPLNVSMVPEIPTDYTGLWNTAKQISEPGERLNDVFNKSMPTNDGTTSNTIWPTNSRIAVNELSGKWYQGSPISGHVHGCPGICTVNLRAPALFPTLCTSHSVPLDIKSNLDIKPLLLLEYAPPLNKQVLFVAPQLVVDGDRETVTLITGYAAPEDCEGSLNYTICTLESATGEYNVTVRGQDILVDSVEPPTLVALAKNNLVNRNYDSRTTGYPSTLAGAVALLWWRYAGMITAYRTEGGSQMIITAGNIAIQGYGYNLLDRCPSYKDPQEDIMRSLNQMMLYIGASAARVRADGLPTSETYLQSSLSSDFPVNYTTTGYLQGDQTVFRTHYWFFFAAAVVEIACIALVAPTYMGWWKLGRPASFSPLELAKAFESPMLEDFNSNSSGRDLAALGKNVPVRYGVLMADSAVTKTKIAFGDPILVTTPRNGMRFDR